MNKILKCIGMVAAAAVAYGVYAAIRAHSKLVTLDVRNAEVRDVIRKVEWQTWEKIYVGTNVYGRITLHVHKIPLDQALDLISEQASCRWTMLYPLYSTSKSLSAFQESVLGKSNPADNGWTNFILRGFSGRGGLGGPAHNPFRQALPISLDLKYKELDVAILAIGRHAPGRIIPEDGSYNNVTLSLDRATMTEAVSKLAAQVHRKWTSYYVLQNGRGSQRPEASLAGSGAVPAEDGQLREAVDAARQQRLESLLETMTPEERRKEEDARQLREAFQQMTPEQRQQAMVQRIADPQFQQRAQDRMLAGLLNSTPESRVMRTQLHLQRMAQRSK